METLSQTNKIFLFIIVNVILLLVLYIIPIDNNINICIYKIITGKECWNCGMTRAFLSILHLNFNDAIYYNKKVIFIFPLTIFVYIYSWYKYITKKQN